jgi:hypothetical protein
MPRYFFRLLVLGFFLLAAVAGLNAQALTTTRTEAGFLVDHPEEWNLEFPEGFDNLFYFDDGTMHGFISLLDNELVGDDPAELLDEMIDDLDRDDSNNGDFEEPFVEYVLDGQWQLVRASRVRQNDRRLEYFYMADVREISVYLRLNFRRGGENTYLPQMDAMIASVRHEGDDAEMSSSESNTGANLGVDYIGTEGNLLQIGALTASYTFEDASHQLNHPEGWEISTNDDGSLRFVNRQGVTIFGSLRVQPKAEDTAETALSTLLADEEGYTEIESFSLNGLSASRAYRENTRGGTKELAMASLRNDTIALMTVVCNTDDFETLEPVFRAVLYSLRPHGTPLELSLVGTGARLGLGSGNLYGFPTTVSSESNSPSPQTAIPLEEDYETSNGRYTFNYPEDWVDDFDQGTIILSSSRRYELIDPDEGEVQMLIFFADRIDGLDIDEFSPVSLVQYVIDIDESPRDWGDISEFESLGRRGAYADYELRGDVMMRTYFVEMDANELVYVRLDMLTQEDEVEDFAPYALAILETVDFAD